LFPDSGVERASLSLQLPVPARVYASIHDVTGRSVRMLLDETLNAGAHDIAWDGRDDAGRAVSSGIYLVRASARGEVRTARFVMLR
jgi:flagellar hook assembly protein FlgD